jgi:hypothetical protein
MGQKRIGNRFGFLMLVFIGSKVLSQVTKKGKAAHPFGHGREKI